MPAFFFKIAIFCPNPTGYLSYRWRSPLLSPTTLFIFSKKKLKLDDWTFEEYKKITPIGFQEGSLRENISHKIKLSILEDKAQTKKELGIVLII